MSCQGFGHHTQVLLGNENIHRSNEANVYLLIESRVPTRHGEAGRGNLQQVQGRAWVCDLIFIGGIIPHQGTWATQSDSLEIKQGQSRRLEEEKYPQQPIHTTLPTHSEATISHRWFQNANVFSRSQPPRW